jgi:hypothetical protein
MAVVVLGGCARSSSAPRGWLPKVEAAGRDPYGGWITLRPTDAHQASLAGEFIAATADSAYVLTSGSVVGVPWFEVKRAQVVWYEAGTGAVNGWVFGGCLATLSHGFGLMFSLPVWLIAGNVSAHTHVRAARMEYPDLPWHQLRAGARFPGGLPPGLRREKLAGRPGGQATPVIPRYGEAPGTSH